MARVQVQLLQMEGKFSSNIQTPGQPDSYREMQGSGDCLLRIAALAHVCMSLSCQRYHGRLKRKAVVKYQKVKPWEGLLIGYIIGIRTANECVKLLLTA